MKSEYERQTGAPPSGHGIPGSTAARRMGRYKGLDAQRIAREEAARERDFVPPAWALNPDLLPKRPPGKR